MATKLSVAIPTPRDLCPPPLHIKKKARRATLYRRFRVKSPTQFCIDSVTHGPLDDIISEISGNIWRIPSDTTEPGFENWNWRNPLKASSTSVVTPLPVSRIASDQPLTIRKNRHSRSSASESSLANAMVSSSRNSSGPQTTTQNQGSFSAPDKGENEQWPLVDDKFGTGEFASFSSDDAARTDTSSAHETVENDEQSKPKRRGSHMGFLAKGLSRLRRTTGPGESKDTEAHSPSAHTVSDHSLSAHSTSEVVATPNEPYDMEQLAELMSKFKPNLADRAPSPVDHRFEEIERTQARPVDHASVSLLKASIRITPEDHTLKAQEVQEFWVSVEIVAGLHNRQQLHDPAIDVAFIVDIAYYVSEDCLQRALEVVMDALPYLNNRGDRVALYTTHCTHFGVAGTAPDVIYPLHVLNKGSGQTIAELAKGILQRGRQLWEPARPNPIMAEVVLAVAKSLEAAENKADKTHIIVLSPATNLLHKASEAYPELYIHQMNPAVLPYRHSEQLREPICSDPCCEHVFVSNWTHYQNLANNIKQIIRNGRSQKPLGTIENMHIDIRPKKGCEVLQIQGETDAKYLRLGQTHAFFVQIRVKSSDTKEIDLESSDPLLNSSLDATYMRECLHNTKAGGVFMAHLLSVQLVHQNSINAYEAWCFTEAHMLSPKETGHKMKFTDTYMSFHKRHLFFLLSGTHIRKAEAEFEKAIASLNPREAIKNLIERMGDEIRRQQQVLDYEETCRKNLPCIAGRIEAAQPHNFGQKGRKRVGLVARPSGEVIPQRKTV